MASFIGRDHTGFGVQSGRKLLVTGQFVGFFAFFEKPGLPDHPGFYILDEPEIGVCVIGVAGGAGLAVIGARTRGFLPWLPVSYLCRLFRALLGRPCATFAFGWI